jgi:putative nucleotidyltransferase with HDIG domain
MSMNCMTGQSLSDKIHYSFTTLLGKVSPGRLVLRSSGMDLEGIIKLSPAELAKLQTLLTCYDDDTYAHSLRLASLAGAMAHYLQLSQEDMVLVYLAALFHDIGKVRIPRAILRKRGPLNEREWRIMRMHPEIGQRILEEAGGIFRMVAPIVLAHHERWDGAGYPGGLVAEKIPLLARVLAVIDSFDAMTFPRAYHNPLSSTEACAELQKCAGGQYDPDMVTAFLCVLNEQDSGLFIYPLSPTALSRPA